MSKGRGKQYTREEWLAVRASPSLGRLQRSRISIVYAGGTFIKNPRTVDGVTKGANHLKKNIRAAKKVMKQFRRQQNRGT